MGITIDKCRTCKHAFTTGKDRWYCKKSLADKDDCEEYEMTIDEALKKLKDYEYYTPYQELISFVSDWIEQFKSDYENRLKADMVAMLSEIREKAWHHHSRFDDDKDFEVDRAVEDIVNNIDAKINALKGEENVDKT